MLPVLIISQDGDIDTYLDSYKNEHGIHPAHVLDINPEKGFLVEHSAEVRECVSRMSSMENHLVIMRKFDTAKPDIQNALLKTLEEDSAKVHFILVVTDESRLLPTITSRIAHPVQVAQLGWKTHLLETYKCVPHDMTFPQWISMTSQISKADALPFLDELIGFLEVSMSDSPEKALNISTALHELIMIRKGLRDNNMYYEYVLDAVGYTFDAHGLLKAR